MNLDLFKHKPWHKLNFNPLLVAFAAAVDELLAGVVFGVVPVPSNIGGLFDQQDQPHVGTVTHLRIRMR